MAHSMRKSSIVVSLTAIVLCVILITGSTFSLFTGNTDADISISAGQIKVDANIEDLKLSSLGVEQTGDKFANGGTAKLNGNKLDLSNVTPGDRAEFNITVKNTSSVSISYAITWAYSGGLASYLDFYIDDTKFTSGSLTSDWNEWLLEDVAEPVTHKIAVELPKNIGNEAMGLSATIDFDLAAVQYNAIDDTVESADQLELAIKNFDMASVESSFTIDDGRTIVIPEGKTFTLDLAGKTITSNSTAPVIINNGTLNIIGGTIESLVSARARRAAPVNGGAIINEGENAIVNNGTLSINGGSFSTIENAGTMNASGITADSITNAAALTISASTVDGAIANTGNATIIDTTANAINNSGEAAITGATAATLSNSGTATVNTTTATTIANTGDMIIESATVASVTNEGEGELTIKDITATANDGYAVYNSGASLVIEGGSFSGESEENALIYSENDKLTIKGGSFESTGIVVDGAVNVEGGSFDGTIGSGDTENAPVVSGGSFEDDTTVLDNLAYGYEVVEDENGNKTVQRIELVKIGTTVYSYITDALAAVKNGETITLLRDIIVEADTSSENTGINALYYNGDQSFTLNLNGHKIQGNTSNVVIRFQKAEGAENTITIKNGTVIAGPNTWSAISIGSNATVTNVNLEGLTISSEKANDLAVRARVGSNFTITDCTVTATNGAGAICAGGGNVTINNTTVSQSGVYNWNSVALGISGGAKMTVNSGVFASDPEGNAKGNWVAYIMSSGGTLEINDGTFTGTVAETANASNACGIICADKAAIVNIYGGTFNSNGAILDMRNNVGTLPNPQATIYGGTFSADPKISGLYSSNLIALGEGCVLLEKEGVYTVSKPVAQIGDTIYYDIDEAVAAWTNGKTLTLLSDVTLSETVVMKSTEHHILNLGTYTLYAAKSQHAIEITCDGRSSASYALTINADANNPGGITATGKSCIYYKKSGSTKDRPIILINNGVFNGSYSINSTSNGNTNCPQVWINGGTFNAYMNLTKNMLKISGGTFNCSINCTGDSSAYRQISGGRFKSWQFMTADANNKFWVGTALATYDVGLYVDDEGYLVVGGAVITEAGDKFVASSANYSGWSSYLKYSSAATYGLYYTSLKEAFADNNKASGKVTVYVDTIDMTDISYSGTIVTTSDTLTITFANGATVAWTVVDANGAAASYTDVIVDGVVTRTYTVA